MPGMALDALVFGIDGTLIDSNDAHTDAWSQALIEHGIAVGVNDVRRLIGMGGDWSCLDEYLVAYVTEPALRATVYASTFAATLEMVREGVLELHQHAAFAPIYLRKRIATRDAGIETDRNLPTGTGGEEEGRA